MKFRATLEIIGINPFVFVPETILNNIFTQAGKNKGYIPVCGKVNDLEYQQTLLKYKGAWRLYINLEMLLNSPRRIGETITVTIEFDTKDRTIPMHPILAQALDENKNAKAMFYNLTPSVQKEIIRSISYLKKEESVKKNVALAIGFLKGENKFLGRNNLKILT